MSLTIKQRIGRWAYPRLPVSRSTFDSMRAEIRGCLVRSASIAWPPSRYRLARLRRQAGLHVNVACGSHVLPGFVNLDLRAASEDVVIWDCRRRLPFSDQSAVGIRIEHFVEHLDPRDELPALLRDCHRVLTSQGTLRVVVPDAEQYLRAYCRDSLDGFRELAVPVPFPNDLPTRMDVINHVFHQWHEHRWAYDLETLTHRLRAAGFTNVVRARFGWSRDPALGQDRGVHAPYSLYVDAWR